MMVFQFTFFILLCFLMINTKWIMIVTCLFLWLKFSFSKRFWKKKGGGGTASPDTRKRQVLESL